jgi:hypothetical protein
MWIKVQKKGRQPAKAIIYIVWIKNENTGRERYDTGIFFDDGWHLVNIDGYTSILFTDVPGQKVIAWNSPSHYGKNIFQKFYRDLKYGFY